jgi:hypothetical protein
VTPTNAIVSRSFRSMERKFRIRSGRRNHTNQHSWSAICRGATLWGLENSKSRKYTRKTVTARIARNSYGFCCSVPFNKKLGHLDIDRMIYPDGSLRAKDQMEWLLRKVRKLWWDRCVYWGYSVDWFLLTTGRSHRGGSPSQTPATPSRAGRIFQ